ncbi:hypothetical protein LX32DRAFT_277625 [Colletotrichum zoysiae]|uniref:Uncharacterized protein n=1 Tax=Colletotrichum zoysiae TaxID=1216348 RepID=A0AAD9LTY1_9PEZI|nr:hypothetical protein LX32DRAFT_277625 [Colletotrichum zoysiae]
MDEPIDAKCFVFWNNPCLSVLLRRRESVAIVSVLLPQITFRVPTRQEPNIQMVEITFLDSLPNRCLLKEEREREREQTKRKGLPGC